MNDNLDYTEYNEEKNRIPWLSVILSILILIVLIVAIILLVKGCNKGSLRDDLIKVGKTYYEENISSLPQQVGECKSISLRLLKEEGIVKSNQYNTCDLEKTYVNVCYLESKEYHYSATLSCEDEKTNYGIWQDGKESDLTNLSDVRFLFVGEEKKTATKYYYQNDLDGVVQTNNYYKESPNDEYTLKEDEQTGYKWYVETSKNVYWENGNYSSIQPSGYPNKGASTTVVSVTDEKPKEATYRKIEQVTIYRKQEVARPYIYTCYIKGDENSVIYSPNPCSGEYSEVALILYTCDGNTSVAMDTVCSKWTEWTLDKCVESTKDGIKCEVKSGYKYTDTKWKWFKKTTVKEYYPSGATESSEETTYYISSPLENAIKDETTKTTVYKYFKLVDDENPNYLEWNTLNDNYVSKEELIKTFQNLKYNVNSLTDINKHENIRYKYKLQYRNVEE